MPIFLIRRPRCSLIVLSVVPNKARDSLIHLASNDQLHDLFFARCKLVN